MTTAQLHVVLVEPEIHWNTGNSGRTCLAVGAQLHLVAPLGFSIDDRAVKRAGLDYWPRVNPQIWASWADFAVALPSLGTPFLFTGRASTSYWQVRYPKPSVLIFGRESTGLGPDILNAHKTHVRIPMADESIRSLNLSTSVALGAYEVIRQWGAPVQG